MQNWGASDRALFISEIISVGDHNGPTQAKSGLEWGTRPWRRRFQIGRPLLFVLSVWVENLPM